MTTRSRRIGILNNNTDRSAFAARFPDDGHKVLAALQPLRPAWGFDVWQTRDGDFPPDPYANQGFVLTGSVASLNDAAPWMLELGTLVRQLHQSRVPLVGRCFVHQMMLAASFEGVPGIDGDCGACLSCATCHVEVDGAWWARVCRAGEDEDTLLDSTGVPRQPHSWLSCQIFVSPALDGLVLHVPTA